MNYPVKNIILLALLILLSVSCDDGDISSIDKGVDKQGYVVRMTGSLKGFDTWPESYSLVVAGFRDDASYAAISKNVPPISSQNFVLSGIDPSVKTIELCVINTIRKRVVTFHSIDVSGLPLSDTVYIDLNALSINDISMFSGLQRAVFDGKSCTGCHGVSRSAAALDLSADNSYSQLVNVPSTKVSDALRVQPGASSASILYTTFDEQASSQLFPFHNAVITKPFTSEELALLKDWIDDGARNAP